MKYECDMIEDLLPLYKDDACSGASKRAVEEHLNECPKCKSFLDQLKDLTIDEAFVEQRENVIESQSKFFKRKSAIVGAVFATIFAIPILVCLIANLATGHALSWFFIVLAAMLIPTSLIVLPLMVPKYKAAITLPAVVGSIILLLAVCCIYSHGNWFFVAGSAVLFGLTVVFSPFIAHAQPVRDILKNNKGLAVMVADTITFYLMMLCIGIHVSTAGYFATAFGISAPCIAIAWLLFAIIRYLPSNGLVKAGACIASVSVGLYVVGEMIERCLTSASNGVSVYYEPGFAPMFVGIGIGAIFALIGLAVGKKGGNK